jgi:glutamine amidotransferase
MSSAASATLVIDTGGNLGNLGRALERAGAGGRPEITAEITADPQRIAGARRLLLPGVGAFAPRRAAVSGALEAALRAALAGGAWLLGI